MRKLIEEFLQYYMTERSLEGTLSLISEQTISIGTGEHEIAKNKEELCQLLEAEFTEMPMALPYQITDYKEVMIQESVCNYYVGFRVWLKQEDHEIQMKLRFTCTAVKEKEQWRFVCFHMSTPAQDQEKDMFFPLHYGTQTIGQMTIDSGKTLIDLMTEAIPGGIVGSYLQEGLPLYTINDKILDILGYTYEELITHTGEKMINIVYADDRKRVEESIMHQLNEKGEYEVEYRAMGNGNRIIWVHDIGKKIITEAGRDALISVLTDITERIEREKRLIDEAEHDFLTNLYNRKKARSLLKEEFSKRKKGTLFICDIDNFKRVNDTMGHVTGDDVLKKLAFIIKKHTYASCVTARLGGDEYIVFFPEYIETAKAINTMRSIQDEFAEYMRELAPELAVSLSAGGASREGSEEVKVMYKKADTALYLAKKKKNTLELYKSEE